MAEDSYATIGLEGPAGAAADPSLVEDPNLSPTISSFFTTPTLPTSLNVTTLTGGSWYVLNTAANALPDNGRWLTKSRLVASLVRLTTKCSPSVWGLTRFRPQLLNGAGTFGASVDVVCGCMDDTACNYDADATNDDGFAHTRLTQP